MSDQVVAESSKRSRSPVEEVDAPASKKQAVEHIPSSSTSVLETKTDVGTGEDTFEDITAVDDSGASKAKGNQPSRGKGKNTYKGKNQRHYSPRPAKEDGDEAEDGEGKKRLPKKKAAILLGYCGTGYSGMQIQTHGAKTIEGDFFEALVKAGAVSSDNADDHRKVDVNRAARTDAGVHAAGNVISMKMILAPPLPEGYDTLASYVNSFLPPQIRMWGFVRTMKSFAARIACDSRKYEYLLPSYCLLPPASRDYLSKQLDKSSLGWRTELGPAADFADQGIAPVMEGDNGAEIKVDPKVRGEFERKRGWRVDQQTLDRFKNLIAMYKGSHNYHNYTVGKPFTDKTVRRHMISLTVNEPVVVGEIEWISVQIHGQSFMLHQIRKMLSMAMLACRTGSPPSLISNTFGPKRIHIPKAPPLGLLLEAPQFGLYNDRIGNKPNGNEIDREPIDWDIYADQMKDFKLKFIYEKIRQDELETHVFHKWMRQMDVTETDILAFLNSKGEIPPEAEVGKRGEEERAKKAEGKSEKGDGMDSDEEEVDQAMLKRGDLEG